MAISRNKKEELVAQYTELVSQASALVFTDYRGATVAQIQSLRNRLRGSGTTYMVVKNTLFGLVLERQGVDLSGSNLTTGPIAVAFLGDDIGTCVTELKDWLRKEQGPEPTITLTGGVLGTSTLDVAQAEAMADLPTREEILAKLLATINAPATDLVRILNAPATSLARVISAPGADLTRVIQAHVQKQKEAT